MRISDCEFMRIFRLDTVRLAVTVQQFAIRNPKFEIYVAA